MPSIAKKQDSPVSTATDSHQGGVLLRASALHDKNVLRLLQPKLRSKMYAHDGASRQHSAGDPAAAASALALSGCLITVWQKNEISAMSLQNLYFYT